MGFFDGLLERTQNPLFLGGINLMMGAGPQGMMQGMAMGSDMQERARKRAQEEQRNKAMQGALGGLQLNPQEQQFLAASPEAGTELLQRLLMERNDPMSGIKRKTAEANLQQTQLENSLFPLKSQQIESQIAQARRGGESPSNVREWQYFNNLPQEQKAEYMRLRRAQPYYDTGTEFVQPNPVDPTAQGRIIPKDIAGAEAQKIIGKETGERQMAFPKAAASLESANAKTAIVMNKISQVRPLVSGWSVGPGSLLSQLPGSQARDLKAGVDTILANLGFEELQDMRNNSPTGGALGAIAVQELQMLQATKTSLDQAQTVGQFNKALNDLEKIMAGASERRKNAFDATYRPQSQAQGGAIGQAPQSSMPPQIKSPAEYQSLPPGTRYVAPDGQVRIKQ